MGPGKTRVPASALPAVHPGALAGWPWEVGSGSREQRVLAQPKPLSDQEMPEPHRQSLSEGNAETAANPAGSHGTVSHPAVLPSTCTHHTQVQCMGAGAGSGQELRDPLAAARNGTHRPAAGVPDVAIGEGLVDGEPKVSPPDVAHHSAVSPDGLQAKHGHFPGRSSRDSWAPESPEGRHLCLGLAEDKGKLGRARQPPAPLGTLTC